MVIRNNCGNLQAMAKAIWAGLQHRHSTDAEPRHEYCPPGGDSWCGYQRKLAGAEETYEHHNIMPDAIFEVVKPVYVRLVVYVPGASYAIVVHARISYL